VSEGGEGGGGPGNVGMLEETKVIPCQVLVQVQEKSDVYGFFCLFF
jgi:hypothetical protein